MTRDGMTPERFEALAEAFGGDIARWPVAERDAAAAMLAAEPAWADATLARAGELDAMLDALEAPRADGALAERIARAAPAPRRRWPAWLAPAGLGVGLAAACAAGVVLGVQLGAAQPTAGESLMTAADDEFSLYLDEGAG
jgi:ferric-dicitrate binding protein FerR (iron transport regulator)